MTPLSDLSFHQLIDQLQSTLRHYRIAPLDRYKAKLEKDIVGVCNALLTKHYSHVANQICQSYDKEFIADELKANDIVDTEGQLIDPLLYQAQVILDELTISEFIDTQLSNF